MKPDAGTTQRRLRTVPPTLGSGSNGGGWDRKLENCHIGVRNPQARITHQPRRASSSWNRPEPNRTMHTIQRVVGDAGQPQYAATAPAATKSAPLIARAIRPRWSMFGENIFEPLHPGR